MKQKRILTIQDISCVGRCSLTVAHPVLCACGHEVSILPTAILSTHTGGFGKPQVVHLHSAMEGIIFHWHQQGITFDAILVGYLGSVEAIHGAELACSCLKEDGLLLVDPAMADHGKVYSGLSDAYVRQMSSLCRRADVVFPNMTEAALLVSDSAEPDLSDPARLLAAIPNPVVVLTGGADTAHTSGAMVKTHGTLHTCAHPKVPGTYHGTGDLFAACYTGCTLLGRSPQDSAQLAGEFVCRSLLATPQDQPKPFGVHFEQALPWLSQQLQTTHNT